MRDYTLSTPPAAGFPFAYAIAFAFGFAFTLLALQAASDETLKP